MTARLVCASVIAVAAIICTSICQAKVLSEQQSQAVRSAVHDDLTDPHRRFGPVRRERQGSHDDGLGEEVGQVAAELAEPVS